MEFFLYSRESCHLCHEFQRELDSLLAGYNYRCHVLDVDTDAELAHRYGARLPVLESQGLEICEQGFDAEAILEFVRRHTAAAADSVPDRISR